MKKLAGVLLISLGVLLLLVSYLYVFGNVLSNIIEALFIRTAYAWGQAIGSVVIAILLFLLGLKAFRAGRRRLSNETGIDTLVESWEDIYSATQGIRNSVVSLAVWDVITTVAIGIFVPKYFNPSVSQEASIMFSLMSAWVIGGLNIQSRGEFSYPPNPRRWCLILAFFGFLWGLTPGFILGLGDGAFGLGMVTWLFIATGFFSFLHAMYGLLFARVWSRL